MEDTGGRPGWGQTEPDQVQQLCPREAGEGWGRHGEDESGVGSAEEEGRSTEWSPEGDQNLDGGQEIVREKCQEKKNILRLSWKSCPIGSRIISKHSSFDGKMSSFSLHQVKTWNM